MEARNAGVGTGSSGRPKRADKISRDVTVKPRKAIDIKQSKVPAEWPRGEIEVILMDMNEEERRWLHDRLERGQTEESIEFRVITPPLAKALLSMNVVFNRHLQRRRVERHNKKLRNGQFKTTHQGVAVSKNQRLLDGQARLTAIVETGVSAKLAIAFGLEDEVFDVLDTGRPRNASDFLSILGAQYSALLASLSARLYAIENKNDTFLDSQEVTDYARKFLNDELIRESCKIGMALSKVASPTAFALAYHHICSNTTRNKVNIDKWFEAMRTGEDLSPAQARSRDFVRDRSVITAVYGAHRNMWVATIIVRAWNAHWKRLRNVNRKAPEDFVSLPEVEV